MNRTFKSTVEEYGLRTPLCASRGKYSQEIRESQQAIVYQDKWRTSLYMSYYLP